MKTAKIKHLGIILDGNRRWARRRGLPTLIGHKKGYKKVLKLGDWCLARGIEVLTVFAFSTENWNRSKEEVSYLMDLLRDVLKNDVKAFHQKGIKIQFLGRLYQLPKDLQKTCAETVELTKNNKKATVNFALSYGGQAELVDAINAIIKAKVKSVTKQTIQKYLYDSKMPPADMVIRTSGEQRTSGFLLWEAAYSELYFTTTCWPAFTEKDLDKALAEYAKRNRTFGGN